MSHRDARTLNHPAPKPPELYDFGRPTTLAREHSRVLEVGFESLARQWGTQLTANIRTRAQVTFDEVKMATYDEYAASLPPLTTMVLCDLGDEPAKSVIQFPGSTALSWFSHMLGGDGSHDEPERPFTQIEQSLLGKLVADLIDDLRYCLNGLITDEIAMSSVTSNSQFAQAAAPGELMVIASFTVQTTDRSSMATLAFPSEVILRRLGDANPVVRESEARTMLERQLARVPVSMNLQLTPLELTAKDVLQLEVGQLIKIAHSTDRPMHLAAEGHIIGSAALGRAGHRLACTITDTKETR
ncbi:flagellar motor switch protein FliM [Agromyces sp. NPDC057679]|uniref:flagellar motor switch protein FliM n=1 Tax=Agromyces sp. NPDC057679 TaxID=3346207 RepID=UPI0036730F6D